MIRRTAIVVFLFAAFYVAFSPSQAEAQQAYGRNWGQTYTVQDWQKHYHYPYKYYPQNFQSPEYYKASADPTNRYPKEMRVPQKYDRSWQNYYPVPRKYHFGHHFILDVL